jgi:hypothetical protein
MLDDEKRRLDYFREHVVPWQMEHIKLRAIGLQFFIPVQGVLFGAWHVSKLWVVAVFGIISCISIFLWDERNRYIIGRVHHWGQQFADKVVEGVGEHGVYHTFGALLERSGHFRALRSHTVAIRLLLVSTVLLWVLLLTGVASPSPNAAPSPPQSSGVVATQPASQGARSP